MARGLGVPPERRRGYVTGEELVKMLELGDDLRSSTSISTAWCCQFDRRGFLNRPATLEWAHRPPTLFASRMVEGGYSISFIGCDEELKRSHLADTSKTVQVLYLATHGIFDEGGYTVLLRDEDWSLVSSGFQRSEVAVVVFDTCHLIDPNLDWERLWKKVSLPSSLRLILGFDGPAPMDRGSAKRGLRFAEELLKDRPIADSWHFAVYRELPPEAKAWRHRKRIGEPIVLGIGDTPAEARGVLNATLTTLPKPRTTNHIYFSLKYAVP